MATLPPPPPDRDGDGFAGAGDACPDLPGIASGDAARRGCPRTAEKVVLLPGEDGHVGAVEIDDGRGRVTLDRAYATAEVSTDGRARPVETVWVWRRRQGPG